MLEKRVKGGSEPRFVFRLWTLFGVNIPYLLIGRVNT